MTLPSQIAAACDLPLTHLIVVALAHGSVPVADLQHLGSREAVDESIHSLSAVGAIERTMVGHRAFWTLRHPAWKALTETAAYAPTTTCWKLLSQSHVVEILHWSLTRGGRPSPPGAAEGTLKLRLGMLRGAGYLTGRTYEPEAPEWTRRTLSLLMLLAAESDLRLAQEHRRSAQSGWAGLIALTDLPNLPERERPHGLAFASDEASRAISAAGGYVPRMPVLDRTGRSDRVTRGDALVDAILKSLLHPRAHSAG